MPVKFPLSRRCQPVALSHHTQSSYLTAPVTACHVSVTCPVPASAVSAGAAIDDCDWGTVAVAYADNAPAASLASTARTA